MSALELGESLGVPRDRLCEVLTRGFGQQQGAGQHRDVRRHPGRPRADRRCAAAEGRPARGEPGRGRVGRRGRGLQRRRHRAGVDGSPADDPGRLRRRRPRWAHRWCAGSSSAGHDVRRARPHRREARGGRRTRRHPGRRCSRRWPTGPRSSWSACSPTSRYARSASAPTCSPRCRPGAALVLHTTGSPRTAETTRRRGARTSTSSTHRSAAVRTTSPRAGHAVRRRRRRARWRGSGRCWPPTATRSCTSGALGAGQKVKLVNNTLFAAQIGLVAEGVRLAADLGVDESALLERAAARQRRQPGAGHRRARRLGGRVHRRRRRIHRQGRRRRPEDRRRTRRRPRRARRGRATPGLGTRAEDTKSAVSQPAPSGHTVSVTVLQPSVTFRPAQRAPRRTQMTKPKSFRPVLATSTSRIRTRSTSGCATKRRCTTTRKRTSTR